MLNTLEKVVYRGFGLNLISEIPLPELPQMSKQKSLIDVEINIGDLTTVWAELVTSKEDIFVKEDLVMFKIPSVATFSVQEGKKIIVSPMKNYSEDIVRLYLLGTCMGAILFQRKILPLHGSAICINGRAYGFVGDSGAGKSTLASAFLKRGYQLITDDVIAVSLQEDIPFVTPSYPQQKLWEKSLNEFGMEINQYRPLYERETKYAVPVPSQFTTESIPLAGVFELVITNHEEIEIKPVNGLERLHTLFYHTYRNFMISPAGLLDWHFHTSAIVIDKIDFFQLRRPCSRFTANELIEVILNTLQLEE